MLSDIRAISCIVNVPIMACTCLLLLRYCAAVKIEKNNPYVVSLY